MPFLSRRQHLAVLSLSAAVALMLLTPGRAEACSGGSCPASEVAPAVGALVPANVPAFPVELSAIASSEAMPGLRLLGPDGQVVASHLEVAGAGEGAERILLKPDAPLIEGATYSLEHLERCDGTSSASAATPAIKATSFTAAAAAPLPTTFGSIAVQSASVGMATIYTGAGTCVTDAPAEIVALTITPDPALVPWLPMVRFITTVDGQPWRADSFGHQANAFDAQFHVTASIAHLYALCSAPPPAAAPGLALGTHSIEITAEMPGLAAPLPVATLTHAFSCSPGSGGAAGAGAAGAAGAAAAGGPAGAGRAGEAGSAGQAAGAGESAAAGQSASAPAAGDGEAESGCATPRPRPLERSPLVLGGLASLLAFRARRRGQRR